MKKFLLVDDHSIVRSGVKLIIRSKYINAECDEAVDGDTAFEKVKSADYDLIVLDIHMPNTDPLGLIENIVRTKPQAKILIFTMGAEEIFAKRYLKLGVKGFLSKESDDEEISRAIDLVINNRKYISESLMTRMTDESLSNKSENPFNDLSNRELEIVLLLISGKSISEITEVLNIQNSTVGTHKSRILEKLKVGNVIELRELARIYHLI